MQCTYILRRKTTDARQNYAKSSSKEEAGGGTVGNPVYVFVSLLCYGLGCTHVPQGSYNTLGVSGPIGSALHTTTWRSEHRDKGQTHTAHSESEGAQDLLGGSVTGKLDLEAGAAIGWNKDFSFAMGE